MDGTTVVVTGAGSGIGRTIARATARRGAEALVLLDVDEEGLQETARLVSPSTSASRFRLDVTDSAAVETTFNQIRNHHGCIDFLFNSAGIQAGLPAWPEASPERMRAVVEVNVLGVMFTTSSAIPLMRDHGGSILNVASISGLQPYLSGAIYGPSKAAVIHFTQCNKELATQFGIRVNAICPSMVDTPFLRKTGEDGQIAPWLMDQIESGLILTAEQVADAAIHLACDETRSGEFEVITPNDNRQEGK
jgi:NAD(P)-dependent dehydrogenase (short-subunit alcohol dehydrogenase family)